MNIDLRGTAPGKHILGWLAPALFALLVSSTIRFHSLAPVATLPRVVGNLLALSAVALLALMSLGRRLSVPRDIALLLLAMAVAAAVSVLGSVDADISLLRLELYLAAGLVATSVYLAYRDAQQLPLTAYFLVIAVVHLPFLIAVVLWIGDLTPPFWQYGTRVADFAHVRHFGYVGFYAAASGTALAVLSRRMAFPALLLAFAALFGIVLTGSRGALLSWVLFVLLLCCFSRARWRAGLHGIAAFAISAGLVWYLDSADVLPSPNIFRRVAASASAGTGFDTGRIDIWIASLKQIAGHPLFGSGPEGYSLSGCCDRRVLQSHDFILQFLMEFGIVGCAIVALVVARTIRHLGGLKSFATLVFATDGNRVLACLLASHLAYGLIDAMLYHVLPLLHLALFSGLFAAGLSRARNLC